MKQENILYKIWRVLYPIGVHFIVANVASVIGIFIFTFILALNGNMDQQTFTAELMDMYMKNATLLTTLTAVAVLPLFYFLYRGDKKRNFDPNKYNKPAKGLYILPVLLAAFSCLGLNNLISISPLPRWFPGFDQVSESLYSASLPVQILGIAIIVPLVEELLFRGLVYGRLRRYTGVKIGALITSFLFGAYHGNMVQFVYAFCLSLIFIFVMEKYRSLWAAIIMHMAANFLSVLMTETLLFEWMYSSTFILIIGTVLELIAMFILIRVIHRKINLKPITKITNEVTF